MAALAVKGSPCVATLLSGRKPRSSNSKVNFCNNLAWQGSVVSSTTWSMDNNRAHMKLRALGDDIDFSNPFAPGIHIDLLNRMSVRSPMLEKTKEVVADQRKRRLKAFQQRTRDFVDGLVQHISSKGENYKYFITASKENTNMIMEQGYISCHCRDEILNGLERIEKDIGDRIFEWRKNVDVRTNIIGALIEIVGVPAKRMDSTISHYFQQLTALQIWCCDSIDNIISQIKELQLELILLAIRNEGLVLPCTRSHAKWILLGDLVLSNLEKLEMNVSRLLSCKDKMNCTLLADLPSGNNDGSKNSSSKDRTVQIHNSIINFGNAIIGDVAHDLSNLERDLASWIEWNLLMPNDIVTRSHLLMNKSMLDMDEFTAVRSSYSIYVPAKDSSERFLAVYKIIPEVLKAASDFVKSSSFNHENIQSFPPPAFYARGLLGRRAIKEVEQDQIDDTRRKLIDWLQHLQPARKV